MTQPMTLPASRAAAQMATALELVDVVRIGDVMEARHRETGQVLGRAVHSRHPQCEWIGWLVEVDRFAPEVIRSPGAAEMVLIYLAGALASRLDGAK